MAKKKSIIDEFMALPKAEKNRIADQFEREIPLSETRPPNAAEKRLWAKAKRRMARNKAHKST